MRRDHRRSITFVLALLLPAWGCAQGRRYVAHDGGADAPAPDLAGPIEHAPDSIDDTTTSEPDGSGGDGGALDVGAADAGMRDASVEILDVAPEHASGDAAVETGGCPADRPVLDNGLCCATGQRNCGGACVTCAAGSVCAGASCACPAMNQCAPAVPTGWLGPVAADLTGTLAACGAAYPTAIAVGTLPAGGAAQCACTCGACSSGTCEVFYDRFPGADCTGTPVDSSDIGGTVNECVNSIPNGDLVGVHTTTSLTGSSCAVTRNNVTKPAASWGKKATLCSGGATTPGACTGGQVCTGLTTPQKTCVYQAGSLTCPAGYPIASTQYQTFADSRDCACACNPKSATCSPMLSIIATTNGCTADTGTAFTGCDYVFQGATHGLRIDALNVTVVGMTSFASSGSVTAASPLTVCCTN